MLRIATGSAAVIAFASLAIHFGFGQAYTVNPMRPGLAGITSHPNSMAPIMSIALMCSLGLQTRTIIGFIALRFCSIDHRDQPDPGSIHHHRHDDHAGGRPVCTAGLHQL